MDKRKLISCLFVLFTLCLALPISGFQRAEVSKVLSGISENDRKSLELFFQELIYKEDFGFTLFGDKPISLTGYFDPLPIGNYLQIRRNNLLKNGWETWKKYHSLLPQSNYLLIEEQEEDGIHIITIINKKALRKVIQENLDLFQKVLGNNFTLEEFIRKMEEKKILFSLLCRHEGLYGILLGYGKTNACLYQRREELHFFDSKISFSFSKAAPSKPFLSLDEEIYFLKEKMIAVEENSRLSLIKLPQFIGIKNHPETKQLRKKYREARLDMIFRLKIKENFLQIVMKQIMERN